MSERSCQGITLIELLMVLTVAAILAVAAIPPFLDLLAQQRLKSAAETLYAHLHQARLLAVKTNTPITVSFHDSALVNDWCYGLSDSGPCRCAEKNSCRMTGGAGAIIGPEDFQDITLKSNFYQDQVTFTPLLGSGNAGTVTLTQGRQYIRVIVSTLGRVRMCAERVGGYPKC